jgi:hypothetical protein
MEAARLVRWSLEVAGDGGQTSSGGGPGSQAAGTATVSQVLDGHVTLEVGCLGRVDLNGYIPSWQVGGQVVTLGNPVPSPTPPGLRRSVTGSVRFALFYTKVHDRLLIPLLAANHPIRFATAAPGARGHRPLGR